MVPVNTCSSLMNTSPNSRWLAPETIKPLPCVTGVAVESKSADIFAFGMLVIEVLAGKPPFEGCGEPGAACRILGGDRPELPQNVGDVDLTDPMRDLIQRCWHENPTERPEIWEVVTMWECFLRVENDEYVKGILNDWFRF